MKQSDRIRYCREYQEHPLKEEYKYKKEKILNKNNRVVEKFINLTIVLIFVYLAIFIIGIILAICGIDGSIGVFILYGPVVLGLLNFIFMGIFAGIKSLKIKSSKKKYESELKQLEDYYRKKGLIAVEEHELFEHECCEYDDYRETYICCATKQPLSYRDVVFCKRPGNCRYCRAFVTAYLGPDGPKYWSDEFKR